MPLFMFIILKINYLPQIFQLTDFIDYFLEEAKSSVSNLKLNKINDQLSNLQQLYYLIFRQHQTVSLHNTIELYFLAQFHVQKNINKQLQPTSNSQTLYFNFSPSSSQTCSSPFDMSWQQQHQSVQPRFAAQLLNKLQSYQNIRFYSMEIYSSPSQQSQLLPPLQGYFRFRQEMMHTLREEQRSCENIIGLWNALSLQDKEERSKRDQLQLDLYESKMKFMIDMGPTPLTNKENTTNLKKEEEQSKWAQQKYQHSLSKNTQNQQNYGVSKPNSKTKLIRKAITRTNSKKNGIQLQK